MQYIQGVDRDQSLLLPDSIDDYVKESNPVRFIEAYVDQLDLNELGFKLKNVECKGRPAYHPGDLLKLYIYGYLNRVRSSRRLEHETHRNMEVIWLLRKLRPDFKTIADFRKENKKIFQKVYREFTLLCKKLDLFGKELVAIDGSKIKAVNSKARNYSDRVVKKRLAEINEKIERYLQELDEYDEKENRDNAPSREELNEKIKYLKGRKGKFESYELSMKESGDLQVSLTDPDCRSSSKNEQTTVGYNLQISVDSKNKLIAAQEVVSDVSDIHQLAPMAIAAKEILDVESLDVVVDMGYYDGKQVQQCEDESISVYMDKANTSSNVKKGYYSKQDFRYDKSKDCYICPANNVLSYSTTSETKGRDYRYYSLPRKVCSECDLKRKCYPGKERKRIGRSMEEDSLDRMAQRLKDNPDVLPKRKAVVEHCFGTLKCAMDHGGFLTRGLENVRGEMSLAMLAYNIKRVINIIGVQKLIAAL